MPAHYALPSWRHQPEPVERESVGDGGRVKGSGVKFRWYSAIDHAEKIIIMTKGDPLNRSRLMYACADEEVSAARLIIAEGDDVNARDANNWTAMHFAAQLNNVHTAVELMTMLLEAGAEIDPQQAHGNTPLHRATYAARDDGQAIKLLLKHGADRNKANNAGVSPLDLARSVGNFELLKFF